MLTHALAQRVVFKEGKANGVEFKRGDKVERVTARKEVILCGGAFNSPQLLQTLGYRTGLAAAATQDSGSRRSSRRRRESAGSFHRGDGFPLHPEHHHQCHDGQPAEQAQPRVCNICCSARGCWPATVTSAPGFMRSDPALTAPDIRLGINLWSRTDVRSRGAHAQHGARSQFQLQDIRVSAASRFRRHGAHQERRFGRSSRNSVQSVHSPNGTT